MLTVTQIYLTLCLIVALLVQTQRLTPADLALPLSGRALLAEPWRIIAAFCYSDGLTVGLLLRLHTISCVSHTLEHVCAFDAAKTSQPFTSRSPLRLKGRLLHAACLLIGVALNGGGALARPSELAPPFLLGSFTLFLLTAACRLPTYTMKAAGGVGIPMAPFVPYLLLLGSALVFGASACFPMVGAIGCGILFDCMDILPRPPTKPPAAAAAMEALHADHPEVLRKKRGLSRRTGTHAPRTLLLLHHHHDHHHISLTHRPLLPSPSTQAPPFSFYSCRRSWATSTSPRRRRAYQKRRPSPITASLSPPQRRYRSPRSRQRRRLMTRTAW